MASPVVVSRIQNRRGTQDQFNALYPLGYTGTGGCDILLYPDILLLGELALCTDSRRIFLGNENGEYVEIPIIFSGGLFLPPMTISLATAGSFTYIPELDYSPTPFFTLLYDLTDDTLMEDWNTVGTNFSKNGELKITAINNEPPDASLTDTGTEINLTPLYDISFKAVYNSAPIPHIEIWYTHNFPGNLTFSTSTISWISLP